MKVSEIKAEYKKRRRKNQIMTKSIEDNLKRYNETLEYYLSIEEEVNPYEEIKELKEQCKQAKTRLKQLKEELKNINQEEKVDLIYHQLTGMTYVEFAEYQEEIEKEKNKEK